MDSLTGWGVSVAKAREGYGTAARLEEAGDELGRSGGEGGRRVAQPLSAPAERPLRMPRWKIMKMMIMGRLAMARPANISFCVT